MPHVRETCPGPAPSRSERAPDHCIDATYRRLVLATGELRLAVSHATLEDRLAQIQRWLLALGHGLAEGKLEGWRRAIAAQLAQGEDARALDLHFAFDSQRPGLGLSGGFEFKLSLKPPADKGRGREGAQRGEDGPAGAAIRGYLLLPCAPSLLDRGLSLVARVQDALGERPHPAAMERLRFDLSSACEREFTQAAESRLCLRYTREGPEGRLEFALQPQSASVATQYQHWLRTRRGPLFGAHADARVLAFADEQPGLRRSKVLDVGAGTGRNSLALAERGFEVHALDLMEEFVQSLGETARARGLPVRTVTGDLLDEQLGLPASRYGLVLASQVLPHLRSVGAIERFFARASALLEPGGWLLCNSFLADREYKPDATVRELSQIQWSFVTTREELRAAYACHGLQLEREDPYCDYERRHLPPSAWPPTPWFEDWSTGRNVLPTRQPPIQLRWLLFRRR